MFLRIICFLTGFGLTIIGSLYLILYLNFMTIGYNFESYVNFIISRIECWYFIIGITLITLAIFIPRRRKNELHI